MASMNGLNTLNTLIVNDGDLLDLNTLNVNAKRFNGKFERHDVFGQNRTVDTIERIISPGIPTATGVQNITLLETTGVILSISSTSANDTSAGTGAQTIFIAGLDENLKEICEELTLNGQTPVNTLNTYFWAQEFGVLNAGSSRTNEGILYCGDSDDTFSGGVPDTRVYLSGDIGDGLSKTMINRSSSTQNTYHSKIHISSDANVNKSVIVKLYVGGEPGLNSFINLDKFIISSGLVQLDMSSVNRYAPGTFFFLTAQSGTGTIDMVGKMSNIQENI